MSRYLLFGLQLWEGGYTYYTKICNIIKDIYTVLTVIPEYVIGPSGQVFLTNMVSISEASNGQIWHYNNNRLYKSENDMNKKLNILSCEISYNEETICLDDFLENTKFTPNGLTLSVFMAAFTIYSKKLHPWETAKFSIFTRNGDSIEFVGSQINMIEDIDKLAEKKEENMVD